MKTFASLLSLLLLASLSLNAQDTLVLNSGQEKIVNVHELNQRLLYVSYQNIKSNRAKLRGLDLREVYAVHFRDSARVITYIQDTASGNVFYTEDMGRYVAGENYAINHYKAPWVTVGGVAAGFTGPVLNFFWGLLVPAAYTGTLGAIPVSTRKLASEQPELYADRFFTAGYKQKARHKKVMNAIWGSLAGIGAAAITTTIFLLTD